MFMRKLRKDKRGLSLIELVCALAILSIISTTIGGAMVFASNSYRTGSVDTALQQEAQFTVNAIESLIIDATNEVSWTGNVLTIKNAEYTYIITYDSGAQTLRYTQFKTDDSTNLIANNELLAEHVKEFKVNAANFAVARTVDIEMTLENGNSKFTSNYNITSRNDPSSGDVPEVVALINCDTPITLEPQQEYFMSVNVVGTSNTGFDAYLDGNVSTLTKVHEVPGGIMIKVAANETGGDDAKFYVNIATDVQDAEGDPFTKSIEVNVRRVKKVVLDTVTNEGTPYKAGTVYRCVATAEGTNLEEVMGACDSVDPYQYIDPQTFQWTIEMDDGSDWDEWIEFVGPTNEREVAVKLKKDLEYGDGIKVYANSLHTRGGQNDGQWTNKASRLAGMAGAENTVVGYDVQREYFPIKMSSMVGDCDFLRGDDFDIQIYRELDAQIEEDWKKNHPGEEFDANKDGYNAGYTGNHHIRYISEDGQDFSTAANTKAAGYTYDGWKKLSYQGMDTKKIEFKAADLQDMKYMKKYTLDLVYSFTYSNKNNEQCTYPTGFDASNPNQDPALVYTWVIDPIEVQFGKAKSGSDASIDLNANGYLTDKGSGIGSLTKPLLLNKDGNVQITYTTVGPGSNWKAGVNNLLGGNSQLWVYNGGTWVKSGELQIINNFDGNDPKRQTGTLELVTTNLQKDKIYKVVLGDTHPDTEMGGQIYTSLTGYEQYALDNSTGQADRGLIYFQLQ